MDTKHVPSTLFRSPPAEKRDIPGLQQCTTKWGYIPIKDLITAIFVLSRLDSYFVSVCKNKGCVSQIIKRADEIVNNVEANVDYN